VVALPEGVAVTGREPPAAAGAGEPVIRVEGVSRWFGSVVAVNDVTFEVGPGITGLLGPNGAGKTTLLRLITGQAEASAGTVRVFGQPVRDNPGLYRRMGVMTEHESVYGFMTGREFVRTMGRLREVDDLEAAVDRAVALAGLEDAQGRDMGTYSRGMRQRIRLAAALVHDPELLILDEPLKGADPGQRVDFQRLLQRLAEDGHTILVSSHILEEVEQIADTVLLIVDGKLAASGGFRAIRAALNERPYHVRVVSDAPRELASAVVKLDAVDAVNLDPDGAIVVLSRNVRQLQIELPRLAQSASISLRRVEPMDDSLESVFGYLVER
jgi:ABC-2 type transport system ATP-binding protein